MEEPVSLDQLAAAARQEAELAPAIAEQLLRFRGHLGFTPTLQRELLHAFARICKTEHEAFEIGDRLMRDSQYCPVPSAVYAAAAALRLERLGSERTLETYRDPKKPPQCPKCDDTGFVITKETVINRHGKEEQNDVAEFCVCHPARAKEEAHAATGKA